MALLDVIHNDPERVNEAYHSIYDTASDMGSTHDLVPIPFAISSQRHNGAVHLGYATHEWVIDMYD
ncbi:MAG: hypothetical protein OXU36_09415 [Candidatus Poribacteria bacterium]|nr:hypothetical protein [Candidatus Poribacteria bacterium]